MIKKVYRFFLVMAFLLLTTPVFAADAFVVQHIEIAGAERIPPETVLSYLPVRAGQQLSPAKTGAVINALYATGFFERITLAREGSTLVIHVVERPTIGRIRISGNSAIQTDKLTSVMKSLGIAEGRIYNGVTLEKIRQSLLNQYYLLGRYNARVDMHTTPLSHNRVEVNVVISEGLVAKVRHINIIGNHAFSDATLAKVLDLSTPGITTFITRKDRFSQEKLESSLENLRNYYMDRGYIHFSPRSSTVAISPDRKSIYITIVVNEGVVWHVRAVRLGGDTILPAHELLQKTGIHAGDLFSRKAALDGEKAISDALGDQGYIFAQVSLRPIFDEKKKEVTLEFHVVPGKLIYVHHITFTDNTKTNDNVLRRQLLQWRRRLFLPEDLSSQKH